MKAQTANKLRPGEVSTDHEHLAAAVLAGVLQRLVVLAGPEVRRLGRVTRQFSDPPGDPPTLSDH